MVVRVYRKIFVYLTTFSLSRSSFFNSSNGRVVRASACGAVDSGLIPESDQTNALDLVFTASLLDVQHQH